MFISIQIMLKKNLAKIGAWQTFSFIFNQAEDSRLNGHCHEAAYASMLSHQAFRSYLALKLLVQYL